MGMPEFTAAWLLQEPTSPELILAAGESSNSEQPPTQTSAESASDSHVERNATSSLTINQVVPGTYTSLFQARIASNVHVAEVGVSQQTQLDNYDSSEDVDFETLSSFDDTALGESGTGDLDSDETAVSDFDVLEGVSEGELSFSDESQLPSPPMLTNKAVLSHLRYGHTPSAEATTNNVILTESMDTKETDDFGELSCVSDGDDTASYPMNSQITNSTAEQALSHSLCAQEEMVAALPSSVCSQHIPGTPEQAKTCDHSDDNSSCLSDKEWTELSFTSPLFLLCGKGGNDSIRGTYAVATSQPQILPAVECWTTNTHTQVHGYDLQQHTNSQKKRAFAHLGDYEHTLGEDNTMCTDPYTTSSVRGSMALCGESQIEVRTPTHEDVRCKDGEATQLISDSQDISVTCDITDDDFCWDSEVN